jgi:hypothetical protein
LDKAAIVPFFAHCAEAIPALPNLIASPITVTSTSKSTCVMSASSLVLLIHEMEQALKH